MAKPKRHHYLPEFYLAGFTLDGARESTFTVFDRDECQFREQTPPNTAVRGYYYAVEDEATGEKSMHVEEFSPRSKETRDRLFVSSRRVEHSRITRRSLWRSFVRFSIRAFHSSTGRSKKWWTVGLKK